MPGPKNTTGAAADTKPRTPNFKKPLLEGAGLVVINRPSDPNNTDTTTMTSNFMEKN